MRDSPVRLPLETALLDPLTPNIGESVARMARISCLAGTNREKVAMFSTVLKSAGGPVTAVEAILSVADIGRLTPELLICDLDGSLVDSLEMLRQLRFVLPLCIIIIVYPAITKRSWSLACHLAGANGLLSKDSKVAELASGVRCARRLGCFTGPRVIAA